ncbi:MAG: hypothetical protein R2746_10450 [Acidimicrobiales bacterium]
MDAHAPRLLDGVDLPRLVDICVRYGVAELSVFGSVAARTLPTATSTCCTCWNRGDTSDLPSTHSKTSCALFGRDVDLVSKAALHRLIRDDVLSEAQPLYAA